MRKARVHVFAVAVLTIGILIFSQVFAATGVPQIINFQGRLLDSGANLLGGSGTNYCFRFSLYDATSGGTKLWPSSTPSTMTLPVRQGVFDAGIGDTVAGGDTLNYDFQSNNAVYVNVEVAPQSGGSCAGVTFETLSPRQRVESSGYAINSGTLDGFTASQSATVNQIPVLTSGALVLGDAAASVQATGTTALTLQGTGATGNIQFFTNANNLTSAGALTLAGGLTTTAVNGNTITSGTGTLTLAAGKTFTASNTLTLAGTDGSTLNVGAGGTLGSAAFTSSSAYQAPITLTTTGTSGAATFAAGTLNIPQYSGAVYTAGTGLTLTTGAFSVNTSQNIATLSNLTTNGIVSTSGGTGTLSVIATTGSGSVVLATSPTLVTPTLGAASATTINGLTLTASTGTLTVANAKTFTISNTLTLAGTDGSTLNVGTGGTLGTAAYTASSAYQAPITLTTTGTSGAATFAGNTLNIPQYAGASYTAGTGLTLTTGVFSVNTSQNITNLTNLNTAGLVKTTGTGGALSIATAGIDYQAPVTLTTTGTSGAATFIGNTLNVPQYAGTSYAAGTGLTLTGSTFSVNTSQNIAALSNLSTNGILSTTGGTGTLAVTATTGSGNVVLATSPTLVTPTLGAALATSINGNTITASAGTLTLTAGKTFTDSNTLTLAGTDGSTLNVGAGGTLGSAAFTSSSAYQAPITLTTTGTSGAATFASNTLNIPQYAGNTYVAGTGLTLTGLTFSVNTSQSISNLSNLISNGVLTTSGSTGALSVIGTTGTGSAVLATSPTLVTPNIGVATATTINGNTITTGTGTLTIAAGKTFTASNTITLAGTDGSTLNVGAGGTLGSNAFTSTAYAPLASPTFTGTVTIPTPFTLGATSVTSTGTQLNYLASATGTTGTGSVVFGTSPTISGATLTTTSVNGVTLTTGGGTTTFLNANGAYSTPAGGITSVSNADGTLTISPTTGAVVASLALGHANTFTGLQTESITNTATSGTFQGFVISPTYNQASGTAANTDLLINRTQTAVGSGAQLLADFQVAGTSKFKVDNTGAVTATGSILSTDGSSNGKVSIGEVSNFGGIWFGSNTVTPSISNYSFLFDPGTGGTILNAPGGSNVSLRVGNTSYGILNANGLSINNGTTGATSGVGLVVASGHITLEGVTSTGATGTGKFVFDTSPTLTTPNIGVATATTINKVTITAPALAATLTIADGKTFTDSNTLTFAGTDGSTLNIATGGTLGTAAYTAASAYEVPLTFSTGLTRTANTITVNASQNITNLTNLSTAGLVKTTGTGGALSIATGDTDYQNPITLTTTGTSGAATFSGDTLNIPQYPGGASYTFSTGLTNTSGTITVNTSQNIATLSNLTSNGIVSTTGGTGTLTVVSTTGSGNVVLANSPTLVTPTLGVATVTSINGDTITPSSGVLTIAGGKTFTASNSVAIAGNDGSTLNIGTGGTLGTAAYTNSGSYQSPIALTTTGNSGASTLVGNTLNIPIYTGNVYTAGAGLTLSSGAFSVNTSQNITNLTNFISNGVLTVSGGTGTLGVTSTTGTGNIVLGTSPTLVTPTLGNATATTINKVTITAPALAATLTIADGKIFTASNTLTLAGTDGSTLNVGAGGTLGSAAYTSSGAYEVPLTFSTGLTRSTNTITVNTSQNIATLSNLTSNGIVTTSGGTGALSVTATTGSGSVVLATAPTIAGATISGAPLTISGNQTQTAWTTTGTQLVVAAATLTDSSSAAGTVTTNAANAIGISTFTTSANTVTYTNAASLYIAGGPAAGTRVTETNKYGLIIAADGFNSTGNSLINAGNATTTFGSGSALTKGFVDVARGNTSATNFAILSTTIPNSTASSGIVVGLLSLPQVSQSGTAGYTGVLVNATESSVGSGNKYFFEGQVGGVSKFHVDDLGGIVGSTLALGAARTTTAWGTAGIDFQTTAATYTDSSSAAGTVTNNMVNSFGIPTLATSTNAVTYTNAATVYIAGAPALGANVSITNPYALDIAAGNTFLGGHLTVEGVTSTGATGTGNLVFATSPTLTTPNIGAATATTINGNTITTGSGVLTLAAGKTFTDNNTLTLSGTDGSTLNVGAGGTLGSAAYTSSGAYEVPLTFSTGLTRTTNTITVNTSQNITNLTNLNTAGLVKTTGTGGALSIATAGTDYQAPITLTTTGSTGAATFISNTLNIPNYGSGVTTYTFSTGLTNTSGTITDNLATGVSGGQSAIGGTGITDILSLKGTTGNGTGTAAAINFLVGNNGATTAATILNNGNVGIGTVAPGYKLDVAGDTNISSGSAYRYNGLAVVTAQTALNNYYFGGAGNLTATGTGNTASGFNALLADTTAGSNTANGYQALLSDTTGGNNTATGYQALLTITGSTNNTAMGYQALLNAIAGSNTAIGSKSLLTDNTGNSNTAIGYQSLNLNTSGSSDVATGLNALLSNTTGSSNTAIGTQSLNSNTTGGTNTATGSKSFFTNSTGSGLVGLGYAAGYNETGSNAFYVNNIQESSLANDQAYSLLYGKFSGTAGSLTGQQLTINGLVGIGTSTPTGVLSLAGNQTASAWGTAGINFQTAAATYTDSSTAASTTVTNNAVNSFGIPTLAATNTAVIYTNPATLYIAGAPAAGTNVTNTNPLALYVAGGKSSFVGNVGIGTTAPAQALDVRGYGSFSDGSAGLLVGAFTGGSYGALYPYGVTPANNNYVFAANGTTTFVNGGSALNLAVGTTNILTLSSSGAAVSGTFSSGSATQLRVDSTGNLSTSGLITSTRGLATNTTNYLGNFLAFGGAVTQQLTGSVYGFAGSNTVDMRTLFYGNTASTIATSDVEANVLFASAATGTSSSGTNALLANVVINPITITNNGATVTNSASLYVNGAASGATNNYALDVNSGLSYFGGNVGIGATAPTSPLQVTYTNTASSGNNYGLQILPTYNQTSTAAATDLLINRTQTAVGSGAQNLIDAQVGGVSKFKVDNGGTVTTASIVTTQSSNFGGFQISSSGYFIGGTSYGTELTGGIFGIRSGGVVGQLTVDNSGNVVTKGSLTEKGYGSFSDGTQGLQIGAFSGGSGYGAIYPYGVTPAGNNWVFASTGSITDVTANTSGAQIQLIANTVAVLQAYPTGVVINGTTTLSSSLTGLLKATSGLVSTATAGTDYEVPLTFSTGLTRSANTITNNLSTGVSGGQIAIGGVTATDFLRLQGTTGTGTTGTNPGIRFLVGDNGAVTAATILDNGNVGIGVTTPGQALDVNGYGKFGTGSGNNGLVIGAYSAGGYGTIYPYGVTPAGNNFVLSTNDGTNTAINGGSSVALEIAAGPVAYITSTGLGVGGAGATSLLSLSGNQTASAWGTAGVNFSTVAATYTDSSSAAGTVTNNVVNAFGVPTLATSTNTVTYTNAATVYIAGAPVAGSHVTETNAYALYVASGLSQFGNSSVTTGTTVATFQNAGGTCNIVPSTAGGVTCSSDMNLKKNITTLSDNSAWSYNNNITISNQTVLTKILALTPVEYNWNVEQDTDPKHAGFIAQEVQQVFPDLVMQNPTTHLLSLNYSGLVPYTIQAIKEMNVTLSDLPTYTDPTLAQKIATFLDGIATRGEAVVNLVIAKKVTTQELCIGNTASDSVCVTKSQLQQLLQQAGNNNGGGSSAPSTPPASNNPPAASGSGSDQSPTTPPATVTPPPSDTTSTAPSTSDSSSSSTSSSAPASGSSTPAGQ